MQLSNSRSSLPRNLASKYGHLEVIQRAPSDASGKIYILCRCSCGVKCRVRATDLRSGHTKSCGCRRGQQAGKGYARKVALMDFGGSLSALGPAKDIPPVRYRANTEIVAGC